MYSFIHAFIHSSIHPFIHFIHVIHLVRISFEFHSLHLVQSFMKFFTYVVTSGVLSSFLYFDIYKLCTGLIVYLIISETYRRIKHERYIHMYRCTYIYIYIHINAVRYHCCCCYSAEMRAISSIVKPARLWFFYRLLGVVLVAVEIPSPVNFMGCKPRPKGTTALQQPSCYIKVAR